MEEKNKIIRIVVSVILTVVAYFVPDVGIMRFIAFLVPYIVAGYDVLLEAVENIKEREMLDESFLMAIATIGAFAVQEYPEAVFVMVMFQTGELFEHYAVGKARKSVAKLMDIRPDYANVEIDGEIRQINAIDVKKGDIIVVKAGERIPLDGIVIKGKTTLDTSALTGEAVPRDINEGDEVLSGCINKSGTIYIKTNCEFGESTVSRILDMVENAAEKKTVYESFITRFARVYTPIVVGAAAFVAIVLPLIFGNFTDWLYRGLIFLVVSCPCALVISVPLSFFCGIGRGSKSGVLFKGSNAIEALSYAHTVVFDKTGTLTKGTFSVTEINNTDCSKEELLRYGAYAEYYSNHPLAQAIKSEYKGDVNKDLISSMKEFAGMGVSVNVEGTTVLAGNLRLMESNGINAVELPDNKTVVHMSAGGKYMGYISVSDTVKSDSKKAIDMLKSKGIETVMLTGDSSKVAEAIGKNLGIDEIRSELLPQDKVFELEKVIEKRGKKESVVFAGDGINDAPVLARADIGVAMGKVGSDAAIEAADVVIMDDKPSKIAEAYNISKKTMAIVKENIVFSLGIKGLVLVLGMFGLTNMWIAVFADVGVMVLAILNAMRLLLKR